MEQREKFISVRDSYPTSRNYEKEYDSLQSISENSESGSKSRCSKTDTVQTSSPDLTERKRFDRILSKVRANIRVQEAREADMQKIEKDIQEIEGNLRYTVGV